MYGTVAKFSLKPGKEAELTELMREYEGLNIPGAIASYLYKMDADPNEYYMVGIFEDKDQYMLNADSPEQDARYQKFRDLLEDDPEWNDGEIVHSVSWHLLRVEKTKVA